MNTEGGALDFESRLDNKQFIGAINEAERRIKGLSDAAVKGGNEIDDAFQELVRQAQIVEAAMAETEAYIKKLDSEIAKLPNSASKSDLIKERDIAKLMYDEEASALKKLEQQANKTGDASVSLRTRLRQMKEALVEMEAAGLRDTAKYKALRNEFAQLTDAMGDAQAQGKILGSDERFMQGAISGFTGIAGAASAAQGAVGLFSGENENLQKIMLKVQSLMAITIGLQQVEQALNKDSAFRLVYVAKAKEMLAAANNKLAISLGISTAAAKALMAALTLGLSVAITVIIAALSKLSSQQKEAKKYQDEFKNANKEAAKSISEDVGTIKSYLSVAGNYNASLETRNKAIKKIKDMMPEYNGYIDEEGKLIDNSATALKNYIAQLQAVEETKLLIKANAEDEAKKMDIKGGDLEHKKTGKFLLASLFTGGNAITASGLMANTWLKEQEKELSEIDKRIEGRNKRITDIITKSGIPDEKSSSEKKEYDARKDLQKGLVDLQNETNDILIGARKDNYQKTLAEIDDEQKVELQKFKEFQRDIVEKYNEAHKDDNGFKALGKSDADLAKSIFRIDPEMSKKLNLAQIKLNQAYEAKKVAVTEQSAEEVKKIMQGVLDDSKEKQDQELAAVRDKYAKIREELLKNENEITVEQEAALKAAQSKEEKAVTDNWLLKNSKAFVKLFGDIDDMSTKALESAIEHAKVIVEEAADSLDPEDLKTYIDAIEAAEKEVEKRNPFKALKNAAEDLKKALEMEDGDDKIAAIDKAINNLYDSANATCDIFMKIGDTIKEIGDSTNNESLTKAGEFFQDFAGNVKAAMSGAETGSKLGGQAGAIIGAIVGGLIDLIPKMKKWNSKKSGNDIAIDILTQQINNLAKAYDELGKSIEHALGTDAYDLQKEQVANLQEQQNAYGRMIWEEKAKKHPDEEKLAEYRDAYQKTAEQIADIQNNIMNELLQTNIKDFAQQLSDALVSAFQNGEDAATAFDSTVNDMISNVIKNSMKVNVIEKALQPLMLKLRKAMVDYKLSDDDLETILASAGDVKANILSGIEGYTKLLERLGITEDDASLTGNIKGVTEETASVLAGTLNAMRINQAESTSIIRSQLIHLAEIAANTRYNKYLESIDSKLGTIQSDSMRAQGLI